MCYFFKEKKIWYNGIGEKIKDYACNCPVCIQIAKTFIDWSHVKLLLLMDLIKDMSSASLILIMILLNPMMQNIY